MNSQRWIGVSLIRIIFVFAILYFHFWQYTFGLNEVPFLYSESTYKFLTDGVQYFANFAGLFVLFLSFFLFGWKEQLFSFTKWVLICVGVCILQVLYNYLTQKEVFFSWDVFSYIFLIYNLTHLIPKKYGHLIATIVIFTIGLFVPYENYYDLLNWVNSDAKLILLGESENHFYGWSIFPWGFLPLLGFALGRFVRLEKYFRIQITMKEVLIWIILFGLFILNYPIRMNTPVGQGFEEFIFKSSPWFWGMDFVVFLFLLRIFILEQVNHRLLEIKIFSKIDSLQWNLHFGWAYLMQFAFLPIGFLYQDFWKTHLRLFDLLWILTFVVIEFVLFILFKFIIKLKKV